MNYAIALCVVAAMVCGSTVFITRLWLSWLEKVKGPKGLLEERVAALEMKSNQQALASLVRK